MQRRASLIVFGLIAGLLGTALVMSYVRGVERRSERGGETVPVYVATRSITAGAPGSSVNGAVERRSIPRRYAAPGAVSDLNAIKGQVALEQIDVGETLLRSDFGAAASSRGRLAIPRGKEAIAVSMPLDAGLAQYAAPGDRVSVFATFKAGVSTTSTTMKILSGAEVLATETKQSASAKPASGLATSELMLTLAVTPSEAAQLIYATEIGSLWMTLVPQGQTSPAVAPVTLFATQRS